MIPTTLFGFELAHLGVDRYGYPTSANSRWMRPERPIEDSDLKSLRFVTALLHMAGECLDMKFGETGAIILVALHLEGTIDLDRMIAGLKGKKAEMGCSLLREEIAAAVATVAFPIDPPKPVVVDPNDDVVF